MDRQQHLEANFHRLKSMLSDLMERVRFNLVKSVEALEDLDEKKAEEVINSDQIIDNLQRKIDMETVNFIGRFQPLAEDLRYIMMMIKLATDLERIGDLAVNIAEVAIANTGRSLIKPLTHMRKMMAIVESMLDNVIKAYYTRDIELAKSIWKSDEKVDDIYNFIRNEIIEKMKEPENVGFTDQLIDLMLVTRFLERAADHITNICEEIYFIVEGKNLKEEMRR